ncbi:MULTISPECIES: hypothetical protein [unclassified Salinibacterium]|uniref:hypothetical protein n=1 Tax=Salinibacterium sp. GXW1014 TaxID=3377838 RepID=UPI0019F89349|nr:hypothetical protein [Salinibacterium sp.]MBF0671523.1 hypothetical protein [Salinibacterium sp.]
MLKIILILLAIWIVLSIIGFVVEGLFWLAIIGLVLFAITAIFGGIRGRGRTR